MPSPEWWTKLRAKLRPSSNSSKGDKHEQRSAPDLGLVQTAPSAPAPPVVPPNTMAYDVADTISPHDFLPFERMQDALVSAAPSEPASQASSAGYGGAGLFTSVMHQGAGLLPRMAVQSGQSYVDGSNQQQTPIVVDPSFDAHSFDGRQDMSGAANQAAAQAQQQDTQSKLTAAALGTHSTLSEGVARQHRGHRKMHFIKNWLQDAETEEVDVVSAQVAQSSQDPLPPLTSNTLDSQPGTNTAASREGSAQLVQLKQPPPPPLQPPLDSPLGKPSSAISPHGLSKAMGSVDTSRNDSSISSAPGAAAVSVGPLSGLREPSLPPPSSTARQSSRPAAGPPPTAPPSGLPHPSSAPLAGTAALSSPTQVPVAPTTSLPVPPTVPTPSPGVVLQPITPAPTQPALVGTSPALPTAASQQPQAPLPQLPQQPHAGHAPDSSSMRRFASLNAASSASHDAPATMGAPGSQTEPDGVAAGGRWQSRPESEGLENYLASAVTTMTVTSQVEGPDIPKRVAVPSLCSAVISSPNTRVGEVTPSPAALRLPSAASHESTKTIAVAGHCPEDIAAQQWSVDDFVLLRKLYEGALSVICHAQHKKSGRHVALKIYKRSRLHEMERFQLAREICLHIRILHPHILSLYAAWKDSKYVYLVLEWAPHGNLFELLVSRGGKLSEAEAARHIIRPLLSSLAFLHSHSWLHRDIKLENVLLDAQGMVKLCDFGLAIDQKFEQANTRLGTFGYFAPEVLDCPLKKGPFDFKGEPGVPTYGCKVDIWSMGVMSYELLTGKAPFAASSAAKIIDAIRTRDVVYPSSLSPGARDFLASALVRDPEQRASADQLLQHPWLLSH